MERVRVYAEIDGGLLQPLAILAQRECEEIDGLHAILRDAVERRHLWRAAPMRGLDQPFEPAADGGYFQSQLGACQQWNFPCL